MVGKVGQQQQSVQQECLARVIQKAAAAECAARMSGKGDPKGSGTGKATGKAGSTRHLPSSTAGSRRHRQQPQDRSSSGGGRHPPPDVQSRGGGNGNMAEKMLRYLFSINQAKERATPGHASSQSDASPSEQKSSADKLVLAESASASVKHAEGHYASSELENEQSGSVESDNELFTSMESDHERSASVESENEYFSIAEPDHRHTPSVEPENEFSFSMESEAEPLFSVEPDNGHFASMELDNEPSASVKLNDRPSASVEPENEPSTSFDPENEPAASIEPENELSAMGPKHEPAASVESENESSASLGPAHRHSVPQIPFQRHSACFLPMERQRGHGQEDEDSLYRWTEMRRLHWRLHDDLPAVQLMAPSAGLSSLGSLSAGQKMEGGESSEVQCQMTQSEIVTLKDKNEFIQNVSQFFNQEDISDVVLKVGDNTFFAHRFVLAKSSEVFRTMLYDKRYGQAGHPELILEESEECQSHFETFLKFLYTAEVQICVESAVGILCLADKYSVMSLKALCTRYMVENTQSPRVQNALNWYSWAKALHMEDLMDSCSKTIAWNMEQLVSLPDWLHMDMDFLADIISNPQLVIPNEYLLYTALEQWLLHDSHLADLKENCKKLLRLVHFPQMMVQQLYKVETGQLACREGSQEEINKLLNEAYRFRSLCPFQSELELSFKDHFYRPRNYKDLTVDTVRMQNTLRFGIQVDVRTYVGPVPSTIREGEWKITYRKTNESWTLQVYCHESAMVNGEARIQAVLLISDDDDRVLRVETSEETVCSRGNSLTMVIHLPPSNDAKLLTVLIKPLPN